MTKEPRILMIVESPNKVKTIKQFLPKNYVIMASVGHIAKIKDEGKYNLGIDVDNDFEVKYIVSDDKKDKVKELKEQVALADKVILASDPDREGELISYHLKKFLKIPNSKYERVTYHEITKKAILDALNNPRKIDDNMAMSAMTRARLDKIVGYRLSSIARYNVNCKSVGRCQSAGLKVIVDREKEIQAFDSKKYYELNMNFAKDNNEYIAKYVGDTSNEPFRFTNVEDCDKIAKLCKNKPSKISNIVTKDKVSNPKLPFTTSTFQQEVSTKLGIGVKKAMEYAQKLFEGVDINHQHIALITYIRTDSVEFAPEFVDNLTKYVKDTYGKEYYTPIRKVKKSDTTQDGHEAIRPTDLSMTPEKVKEYLKDENLVKVYTIIYKRTIASSMSASITIVTEYSIDCNNNRFLFSSNELKFDGYKKVYNYKEDNDEEELSLVTFKLNEILNVDSLERIEKTTKPPKRYSEASFISTLDKLGIGRPSTYATIVNVLLDESRGYCKLENKVIVPTDKGILLSNFLDKSFSDVININYTIEMEKSLDLISDGKLEDVKFLREFYTKLEERISKVDKKIKTSTIDTGIKCPECGKSLVLRKSSYGEFYGCSGYPKCKHIEKINT